MIPMTNDKASVDALIDSLESHLVDYPTPENIHMQRKYLSDIRQHFAEQLVMGDVSHRKTEVQANSVACDPTSPATAPEDCDVERLVKILEKHVFKWENLDDSAEADRRNSLECAHAILAAMQPAPVGEHKGEAGR